MRSRHSSVSAHRAVGGLLALLGSLTLVACGGDTAEDPEGASPPPTEAPDVVQWQPASTEFLSPACQEQGGDPAGGLRSGSGSRPGCAHARLAYPELEGDGPLEEAMRGWTREILLQGGLLEGPPAESPEDVVRTFVEAFDAYRAEYPELEPGGWELERTVEVTRGNPPVVTLMASEFAYTGGAHPNSWIRYQSFHPETGEALTLERILLPDAEPQVQRLVEARFRDDVGLPEASPLQEAGLFEDLPLVDNMEFTHRGLTFHYNPYAVAPYSMGIIRVRVPWAQVAPHLTPDVRDLLTPWTRGG